ncbi:hypothetical protein [Limnohabitans sp. Jir61]|uniref:hypothetical protein n=1 Tax=Limnohabitans sp. Jir61 TaxID=1826168 RepID=UPI0011B28987|nr:hypothetical protein [Limnohabitans sp. Jir61]
MTSSMTFLSPAFPKPDHSHPNTEKLEVCYEKSVVAFIDALGFTSQVKQGNLEAINQIINLLNSAIPRSNLLQATTLGLFRAQNHPEIFPRYLQVSDSLILSQRLEQPEHKDIDGFQDVVTRIIQCSLVFLNHGFLLRGGLEIGDVWHTKTNIVGPAFIDAYELESKEAIFPRVILGKEATKYWIDIASGTMNRMVIEYQGHWTVNTFTPSLFFAPNESPKKLSSWYSRLQSKMEQQVNNTHLEPKQREKWHWLLGFLKQAAALENCKLD